MDIDFYFEPINLSGYEFSEKARRRQLGDVVKAFSSPNNFPDLKGVDIVIIGVFEDRNAINNSGCSKAPNKIRKYLYRLFEGNYLANFADLGNIKMGNTVEDTYFALSRVLKELIKNNIVPIVIGGSQDLTFANYQAYEDLGQIINIVSVDPLFDLGDTEREINSQSYLSKIILHQPNYLFNFSNIGYQTYFVDQEGIDLMKNLFFDTYRLGHVQANLEEVEPIVRNADLISFDISAIRYSDAPGNRNASPNGLYGEEACKIAHYAGMSDKLTSIGFYEMNPDKDPNEQTAHLVSQIIWYFMDGFYSRKNELPHQEKRRFIKYHVTLENEKDELVFYKSKKSDRWWMEIPLRSSQKVKFKRHHLIPCSYLDYQTALNNELPDRWWKAYQKLM
jgi:arginase family enzyme